MKSFSTLIPLCALSLQLQPALAFWRESCSVSQMSRIDPILNPGAVSGHVHKFAGGNNVDQFSTGASLQNSTCSTCEVQADKSGYWTPQLYYQYSNGTIVEVENDGMTVYYVGRGGNSSNTVPFPEGFKMISGNSIARQYDTQNLTYLNTRPIADRVSFRCIDEANDIPETHYINDTNCVNGLRAQINFQSCWDGVNLYLEGNSHVAYLSGIDYGVCPPTHPVPIPGLFFEVLYWSNRIDQSDGGHFVFSNGDTTGFGFHGDFMNGWDQAVHTQAVQECLYNNGDGSGVVSACSALAPVDNPNFSRTCPQSPEAIAEAITGVLPSDQLPGCNPITSGPADAPQVVCAVDSTTPTSGQAPSPSQSVVSSTFSLFSTNSTVARTTSTDSIATPDSVTDSTTYLATTSVVVATSTSTATLTAMTTFTQTEFTRSYTGLSSGSPSDGGVFATAASSDLASSSCNCYADVTVTITATVTLNGTTLLSSTATDISTSMSSIVTASTTATDSAATTTDSTADDVSITTILTVTTTDTATTTVTPTTSSGDSTDSSDSTSMVVTGTMTTDMTVTVTTTGSEMVTPLSSLPWSAYHSNMPVYSSWYNVSGPWYNFSHPGEYPPIPTTMFGSSSWSWSSSTSANQTSSAAANQSVSATAATTTAVVIASTTFASSTPYQTATITSGTVTSLVTIFVPVEVPTTTSTALVKRDAENARLKAFVTYRLRGREVVAEQSE